MSFPVGPGPIIQPATVGQQLSNILDSLDPATFGSTQDGLTTLRLLNDAQTIQNGGSAPSDLNFAAAFDPSHNMYAVKTDNASMSVLEDLGNIFSTAPQAAKPNSNANLYLLLGGVLFIYLLMKGKFL